MKILGFDLRIIDVAQIKGISKCHINIDFGCFESFNYSVNDNLEGGVFNVVQLPVDVDMQKVLAGEFKMTVISAKKSFVALCDGHQHIDMTIVNGDHSQFLANSLKHLFTVLGQTLVSLDLFYFNKGPTRIKAGTVKVLISIIDLAKMDSHLGAVSTVRGGKDTVCKLHAPKDIAVQTLPVTSTTDVHIGRDIGDSSLDASLTDDSEPDDGSLDEFLSRLAKPSAVIAPPQPPATTSTMASASSVPSKHALPSAQTAANSAGGKKASKKYWYTSQKILPVPAPTNMQRLRKQAAAAAEAKKKKQQQAISTADPASGRPPQARAEKPEFVAGPPSINYARPESARVPVRQQVVSRTPRR